MMISLIEDFSLSDMVERARANQDIIMNQYFPLILGIHGTLAVGGVLYFSSRVAMYLCNRRKTPAGHCTVCGYCLTGLPEARCPECGTPFGK
jgi:hypothetical protein